MLASAIGLVAGLLTRTRTSGRGRSSLDTAEIDYVGNSTLTVPGAPPGAGRRWGGHLGPRSETWRPRAGAAREGTRSPRSADSTTSSTGWRGAGSIAFSQASSVPAEPWTAPSSVAALYAARRRPTATRSWDGSPDRPTTPSMRSSASRSRAREPDADRRGRRPRRRSSRSSSRPPPAARARHPWPNVRRKDEVLRVSSEPATAAAVSPLPRAPPRLVGAAAIACSTPGTPSRPPRPASRVAVAGRPHRRGQVAATGWYRPAITMLHRPVDPWFVVALVVAIVAVGPRTRGGHPSANARPGQIQRQKRRELRARTRQRDSSSSSIA